MGTSVRSGYLANVNEDLFWSKVPPSGPDDCWEWTGKWKLPTGYGMVTIRNNGKRTTATASRIAYALANSLEDLPERELVVCHTCDNPPCCNPAHLWLGTPKENTDDSVLKGRAAYKLTKDDVLAILDSDETNVALGERFGVDESMISAVRLGKTWKHLTADRARRPGWRHQAGVLTEADVRLIRGATGARSKDLAQRFGVTESTISDVRSRRTWKHIR